MVFFRGGWCPICTRHTQQLIKIYPEVKEMGAELVGISPGNPDYRERLDTDRILSELKKLR